jgi:alkanesulfonate monooxygenase SsuD/methylene tetrahydromethanopterin reductase-like flavin-dependent oxidoreductase (luciferase family)
MRVCLTIEGQEDVTWEDWTALAGACERAGIEALFRSDHYVSLMGPGRGSLDAWGTLCALAAVTQDLRLGTLVSPAAFRHPGNLTKLALTADHISGGRVELGMGTGWNREEHELYGFAFPSLRERMDELERQLEHVHRLWADERVLFGAVQRPHPPLVMGGEAGPRAARLAARYAGEYNTVYPTLEQARERRAAIAAACEAAGREPIPFSMMMGFVLAEDEAGVRERTRRLSEWIAREPAESWLIGTPDQVIARLREYEQAGVERVMLQHLLHRDLDTVELIGRELVPALSL